MKRELQIEAMEKADGVTLALDEHGAEICYKDSTIVQGGISVSAVPNYFEDNHIDRMVRGLKDEPEVLFEYHCLLEELFALIKPEWTHLVTPAQKVEAYLKARGLWTKEME